MKDLTKKLKWDKILGEEFCNIMIKDLRPIIISYLPKSIKFQSHNERIFSSTNTINELYHRHQIIVEIKTNVVHQISTGLYCEQEKSLDSIQLFTSKFKAGSYFVSTKYITTSEDDKGYTFFLSYYRCVVSFRAMECF